jgi:fatty acid desaturase
MNDSALKIAAGGDRIKLSDLFSRKEISELTTRSNWSGAWAVSSTWVIIGLTFAGAGLALSLLPLPAALVVCVLATIILAGRQLCLAIINHDAGHGTLFESKWANRFFGDWFAARLIWNDFDKFRAHHLIHHTNTNTETDPDRSLSIPFPTTPSSIRRRFIRDLTGLTGLKFIAGRVLMDSEVIKWTVSNHVEYLPQAGRAWWDYPVKFFKNSAGAIAANAVLLGLLMAAGNGWLYLLWVIAYMIPFAVVVRIRSMAEHGATETSPNVLKNTRTTRAGFWTRLTVAPMNVNYHMEHHFMAAVPYLKLPRMHRILRERGLVPNPPNYRETIQIMGSKIQPTVDSAVQA